MAYAEKRGKGPQAWRVKYKLPSGGEASESGFETKAAALAWGRDQEARIREGRWTDPNAGKTTVGEWIDRWLAIQDVGISTQDNREYLIRRFIRPAWGASELNSLSTEGITRWENAPACPGRDLRADGPRRPHSAEHHPGQCGRHSTAADPVQPRAAAPQPRSPHRPQARTRSAASMGDTVAGLTARRARRITVWPGRRLHHDRDNRLHGPAVGRSDRPGTGLPPPGRDPRRMAAPRAQRQVPPAPAEG